MANLTVATLNLSKGELRWGERAPLLMQQLVELRPDIIGFQEIDLRLDQGNWLCRRFNDLIWEERGSASYVMYHMANPRENVAVEALGIMTHLPVLAHEGFDYLIRNRVAHRIRVEVAGRPLDFYNTHFHHEPDAAGNQLRSRQAEQILAWMEDRSRDTPSVLVGDLNAPPNTRPIRILKQRLRSACESIPGVKPEPTWPSPLDTEPLVQGLWTIDYILVSDQIEVIEAERTFDRPDASDSTLYPSAHYGLTARLEF